MSSQFKTIFGALAISLGHLRAANDKYLFDDQKAQIDEAIVQMRDTEASFEAQVNDMVAKAVAEQLATQGSEGAAALQTSIDGLSARLDTVEAELSDISDGITDLGASADSATADATASDAALTPPDTTTPPDDSTTPPPSDTSAPPVDSSTPPDDTSAPSTTPADSATDPDATITTGQEGDESAPATGPEPTVTIDPTDDKVVSQTPVGETGEQIVDADTVQEAVDSSANTPLSGLAEDAPPAPGTVPADSATEVDVQPTLGSAPANPDADTIP